MKSRAPQAAPTTSSRYAVSLVWLAIALFVFTVWYDSSITEPPAESMRSGAQAPNPAVIGESVAIDAARQIVTPPGDSLVASAELGDSDEVTRLISGRCIDDQGQPFDGEMLIESLQPLIGGGGSSREAKIVDGFFECNLPGKVFRGEYAKVWISNSTHVAYFGLLRIAAGLTVPVRSESSSSIDGKITLFETSLTEWSLKVFFKGGRSVIAVPFPVEEFKESSSEVRMVLFEPADLDSDRPVALMLVDGITPIQRVEFENLRSLHAQLQEGLELRPIVHRFNIPESHEGSPVSSVFFTPRGWEYQRARKIPVENGSCEAAFGVGSYMIEQLGSDNSRLNVAVVELTASDHHGFTNVIWEQMPAETSDLVVAVVTPNKKPLGGAHVLARSVGPGPPGLVERHAEADADGRATLSKLPLGNYRFSVQSKSGRFRASQEVQVPSEGVVIVARERLTMHLNLLPAVPELADAVENGRIWYRRVGEARWKERRNREGSFVPKITVAEEGEYEIAVSTSTSMVGSVIASARSEALIDVQMYLVWRVKGVVETSEPGGSVDQFTVAFPQSDTRRLLPWEMCVVDESGRFELLAQAPSPRLVVFGKDARLRESHTRTAKTAEGEEYLSVAVK